MKKFTLLFIVGIFFLTPSFAKASFVDDFVKWLVPSDLQPHEVIPATQRGAEGVFITPNPVVVSGDTVQTFYVPSLTGRSFAILNNGPLDLFLNKSTLLSYSATPAVSPGDLPASFALNVGVERIIIIFNPSTTTNYYLSKDDLSITDGSNVAQASVFLSNTRVQTKLVDSGGGPSSLASFTFGFILNNATNKDIYVSRLINPLTFVSILPIDGAVTSVKFIDSITSPQAGDTESVFVIPAGTSRELEVTGIIDNKKGTAGKKAISLTEIHYANTATMSGAQTMVGTQLRGLGGSLVLGTGELPKLPPASPLPVVTNAPQPTTVVPVQTITPGATVVPPQPTPSGTPVITKPSPTPTVEPTETPTATPSPTPSTGMTITSASTVVGPGIEDNKEVIGFPVTFSFSVKAEGKAVYMSKSPQVAFATAQTGFSSVLPTINNITAQPSIRTGDGGGYYLMPAGSTRTFQAFAVLKNDGITKAGTQTFAITQINYGTKSTLLSETSTTENVSKLKASVKLYPPTTKPTPTVSPTPSPTPTPNPSGTPDPDATPLSTSPIALCYAVPTSPETGETVFWQAMQSGATGTITYTWSGTDGLTGTNALISKKYIANGRKDATVKVSSSDGQSVTTSCYVNVTLAPSPTPTPTESPRPSGTPTPTPTATPTMTPTSSPSPISSDMTMVGEHGKRGLVAAAFYSLGEFLDSLIR